MRTCFARATAPLAAFVLVGCTTQPTTRGPDARFAIVNGERVDVPDVPMGDADTIDRIIELGLNDNRVMEHLTYLCEEIGPRLTGSTNVEDANLWIRDTYIQWGLDNPRVEEWGTIPVRFDRGPSSAEVVIERTNTDEEGNQTVEYVQEREMQFTTLAWAPGTNGPVVGRVVRMPQSVDEYEAVKNRLGGRGCSSRRSLTRNSGAAATAPALITGSVFRLDSVWPRAASPRFPSPCRSRTPPQSSTPTRSPASGAAR